MKLNIGCGTDLREGYINIDKEKFEDVDKVMDLDKYPYPFKSNSIDKIIAFNVIEHVNDFERCFVELTRILKSGGIISIKVPHFTAPQSNCEFHKTRFWWYSFTTYEMQPRKSKKGQTALEGTTLYSPFRLKYKKLCFNKGVLFWNYLVEPIINLNPSIPVLWEHTNLCYLFPAKEIYLILQKK